MGADVLLSLAGYDLDPNDVLVDDNDTPLVAIQNLDWVLRTFRGEYADDVAVGVDFIKYAGQKSPNNNAIIEDVLANAKYVTTLTGVTLTASSKLGRDVTLAFKARFNADTVAGSILVSAEASAQPGGQSPVAQYLTLRRG